MKKPKTAQIWTVRNKQGQYIGNFQAYTAEQALSMFLNSDVHLRFASKFRGMTAFEREDFTATVETV